MIGTSCPSRFFPAVSLLAAVFLAPAVPAVAQKSPCDPDEPVAAVLRELRRIDGACALEGGCREEKRRLVEEALESAPNDVALHRELQWLLRVPFGGAAEARLAERYRALLDEHTGEAPFLYLYGRALDLERRDAEALSAFLDAVDADPDFPWSHLALVAQYAGRYGEEGDPEKMKEHVAAFRRLCPSEPTVFFYVLDGPDTELARQGAVELRAILDGRLGDELVPLDLFRTLWTAEFRLASPAEHDALRARVRADLDRLRALDRQDDRSWWEILAYGAELAADLDAKRAAEEGLAERFPCSHEAAHRRRARWEEGHPEPTSREDREGWQDYFRGLYETSAAWVEACPENPFDWMPRFVAATELDDLAEEELVAAVDGFLALWRRPERNWVQTPLPPLRAARAFLRRGVRLERVAPLAREALEDTERIYGRQLASPREEIAARAREAVTRARWDVARLTAQAAIGLDRLDEAREAMAEMERLVEAMPPAAEETDRRARERSRFWRAELRMVAGLLDEAEGRRADALAAYAAALELAPDHETAERHLERLWAELGGTPDGLAAWRRSRTSVTALGSVTGWTAASRSFPEFELVDLEGRLWTRADLEGKTTLVNFWATWCGPCKVELPYLEKLRARFAERDDFQILTFNVDDNPGLVAPFVAETSLGLPVLFARDLVEALLGDVGIPQTWIVDRAGVVRWEHLGFGGEIDGWIEEVVRLLEAELGPRAEAVPRP